MRQIGISQPQSFGEVAPDTIATILLAAGAGQAVDLPADAHLARLTGLTSGGAQFNFWVLWGSTAATTPSSGISTGSTNVMQPVLGTRTFQVSTGLSSGFSVVSPTSGFVQAEFWRR